MSSQPAEETGEPPLLVPGAALTCDEYVARCQICSDKLYPVFTHATLQAVSRRAIVAAAYCSLNRWEASGVSAPMVDVAGP